MPQGEATPVARSTTTALTSVPPGGDLLVDNLPMSSTPLDDFEATDPANPPTLARPPGQEKRLSSPKTSLGRNATELPDTGTAGPSNLWHRALDILNSTNTDTGDTGEGNNNGEATIHLTVDEKGYKHALISVRHGDEVMHTHQYGTARNPRAGVAEFNPANPDDLPPHALSWPVSLPNPGAAITQIEVALYKTAAGTYPMPGT